MSTAVLAISVPQGGEWIIILVIALLLFGAKKLPDLGSSVGQSIKNFKRGLNEGQRKDDEDGPDTKTASTATSTSQDAS